jgi:hypothetical protein
MVQLDSPSSKRWSQKSQNTGIFLFEFWHSIRVIRAPIRLGAFSERSNAFTKYNSTSSIQWYVQSFHSPNYDIHIFHSAIYDPKTHGLGYGKSEHIIG